MSCILEFHLSNAMLITSLRLFEQTSDSFYVFRAKNGSIILKADSGFGIMAVVQEMNLQDIINPIGCLDSIKVHFYHFLSLIHISQQIHNSSLEFCIFNLHRNTWVT